MFTQPLCAQSFNEKNMVASVHPLATDAGVKAFEHGGNAVDAAIATALTLGVVDGFNSGIGGGCFILIRTPEGKLFCIDGREMAPAKAHRDMYLQDGKADVQLSQTGPLAVGTPGAMAAYAEALQQFGRLKLNEVMLPAAEIAENGFEIDSNYAARLSSVAGQLKRFDASRQIFLDESGQGFKKGQALVQKDLAETYRQIAKNGSDYFYKGAFAKQVGDWMSENGGVLTTSDFENYHTVGRQPLVTTYRDYTIVGFPPPSSGGVHVAQILNILEQFDLQELYEKDRGSFYHVIVEAMKLAFADRAYWLGDPDFADVPKGLIDKEYAKKLAERINFLEAIKVQEHSIPPDAATRLFEKHTTHLCAVDSEGYWVALTTTLNTTFGSKVVVPGTGVMLNNQMDDFAIAPGVPNAFGLIGNEANSVQPGKRPLSSMSPTVVLKDGKPIMVVGAAGGPKIITQVVWAIVRHLDLKQDLQLAVDSPRLHHQWVPDALMVEHAMPFGEIAELVGKHQVFQISQSGGVTQAIGYDAKNRRFVGVYDSRVSGKAAGVPDGGGKQQ